MNFANANLFRLGCPTNGFVVIELFHPYKWLGGGFKHFLCSPLFGEDSHLDQYFSDGLKPPTSFLLGCPWDLVNGSVGIPANRLQVINQLTKQFVIFHGHHISRQNSRSPFPLSWLCDLNMPILKKEPKNRKSQMVVFGW